MTGPVGRLSAGLIALLLISTALPALVQAQPAPPSPPGGEAPAEVGPGPYGPSWYYRERPLAYGPYAYGPYSGMRGPRPMPW